MSRSKQPQRARKGGASSLRADPNREWTRLLEDESREAHWKRWGPYLSERQWGTVREDYSEGGNCWEYLPHDHARSRAYRWGEDGLLGFCDHKGRMALALALWNGKDPILKERLFGLAGPEGNHGEDVKEVYFYLDSTPTHSYVKQLYKYPQAEYPYARLVEENRRRGKHESEFEIEDTGVFDEERYFDVFVEYAKQAPNDILLRIEAANRGPEPALLHILPTLWFRNTWSWGRTGEGYTTRPRLSAPDDRTILAEHAELGEFRLALEPQNGDSPPPLLFTENETNNRRLFGSDNAVPHVKDAFHDYVIGGDRTAVNPARTGTKAAAHHVFTIAPGASAVVRLRLARADERAGDRWGAAFDAVIAERRAEGDAFYGKRIPPGLDPADARTARQCYAGLLSTKQFYHYIVKDWLEGDPSQPQPPPARLSGRNADWVHLYNRDVISMPDKWEYPWYAAWDLAFHMLPFARIDPFFAKDQLKLFLREWYLHPNGQLPAYEFAFSDVNPPVHAWAAWRVYKIAAPAGKRDRDFLRRVFDKLVMNFTWWVNRKDPEGKNLFAGGFLGLDNIGVFDRSRPLPTGGHLEQADGTAWMAFYCATMLSIALELAREDPVYEDMASKFFEHFVAIVDAINHLGGSGLWDEQDGFYYDQLHADGQRVSLRIRSLVGLLPIIAVEVLDDDLIERLPGFKQRMEWFLENRPDLGRSVTSLCRDRNDCLRLLAIPSQDRLRRVLGYMLDEEEFLSPHGIRSISRVHAREPFRFNAGGREYRVDYEPAESSTGLFGGNSNWRGPVWFPVNYLIVEALERYHHFYGEGFRVECPAGSGRMMTLQEVAREIAGRLAGLFRPDARGIRPWHGGNVRYAENPHWRDLTLFHEYFCGDTGRGIGASHQTGWTALVVRLIEDLAG